VVCEDAFSFDQRLVRRSFATAPDESVTTCGIFCFNLETNINKMQREFVQFDQKQKSLP